jgi:hypothetical protein
MKLIKITTRESKVETSKGTAYLIKNFPKGWSTSVSWEVSLDGVTEVFSYKYEALEYINEINKSKI